MNNDFSSLDRLMELGISMAVAQQMIGTMNHALNQMQTQGAGQPMIQPDIKYFAVINKAQAGPFSESEMIELIKTNRITPDTLVWKQGFSAWKLARETSEINKLLLLHQIQA